MNETRAIVERLEALAANRERAVLATVVGVVGSAYRRPGARMLVDERGATIGSISAGCLERDVVERAGAVLDAGQPRLVEYDTRGDEEIVWGLGLGCNGIVRVLLEPVDEGSPAARALAFLGDRYRARASGAHVTVAGPAGEPRLGERIAFDADGARVWGDDALGEQLSAKVRDLVASRKRANLRLEYEGRQIDLFAEFVAAPREIIVFGAEQDALPVVETAAALGWLVTLVDTRARRGSRDRFGAKAAVVLARASEVAETLARARATAVVVMTHAYDDDLELLRFALASPARYIGMLGPKKRTEKLLDALEAEGREITAGDRARIHAPVGLDLGAETAEEIAIAIVGEIAAVANGRRGGLLKERDAPIHGDVDPSDDRATPQGPAVAFGCETS
jgi:xanthine/CO dehydrogenase XdhC/CoxF family maturation factor